MEMKIPKKFILGGVEITVEQKERINPEQDFGVWETYGHITLATHLDGKPLSHSRIRQTFWHELLHCALFAMKDSRYSDESFVNVLASFISGAIDTMEE